MRFYKSKGGYFYKEYKNGKKVRISKDKYLKLKKRQKGGGPFNCSKIDSLSCENYQAPEIVDEYLANSSEFNVKFTYADLNNKEIPITFNNNSNRAVSSDMTYPLLISLNRNGIKTKFEYEKELGKGDYGSVHEYRNHGIKLALKVEQDQDGSPIERNISETLRNKRCHIIKERYIGEVDISNEGTQRMHYYLMEAGTENLHDIIERKGLIKENFKLIMGDIIEALACLRSENLYYTDLKFKNVLICCVSSEKFRIKFCDLGSVVRSNAVKFHIPFKYNLGRHFQFLNLEEEKLYYIYWNIGIMYLIFYLKAKRKEDFLQEFIDDILNDRRNLTNNYFKSLNIQNINKELGKYFGIGDFKYLSLNKDDMKTISVLD
jgi:hypothetical protein